MRDIIPTIALYQHKPKQLPTPELEFDKFHPWQEEMFHLVLEKPDGRKVTWVYDEVGKTGKTRFAYYMCLTYPEKFQIMNNVGKVSDFAKNMQNFQEMGWDGNVLFLNLSRDYADRAQIYNCIEMVLDGLITCTKYTGGQIWLQKMKVVVLANFPPTIAKLSFDRWDIYEIDPNMDLRRIAL